MAGDVRNFNPTLYANSRFSNYLNPYSTVGGQIVVHPTVDNLFESATSGLFSTPNNVLPQQAARAEMVVNRFAAYANSRAPDRIIQGTGTVGRNMLYHATRQLALIRARLGYR